MYDGLAWLMQIILFLTLGLLVFPTRVFPVFGVGLIISLFLILVARPLSVLLSLSFFKMKFRRRLYISWVGLRGAVPIVFATYPLLAGIDKADMMFNIVFFISVTSVLIQGTTLSVVAKWLNVALPQEEKKLNPTDMLFMDSPKTVMKDIRIGPNCFALNKKIVDLGFPKHAIIAMIRRNDAYITPNGSTVIEDGDTLMVFADKQEVIDEVYETLQINQVTESG